MTPAADGAKTTPVDGAMPPPDGAITPPVDGAITFPPAVAKKGAEDNGTIGEDMAAKLLPGAMVTDIPPRLFLLTG